jgi:hypothetical protein
MSGEERIRILLRIAKRVEVEGDSRAARLFRRMAADARPLEFDIWTPALECAE